MDALKTGDGLEVRASSTMFLEKNYRWRNKEISKTAPYAHRIDLALDLRAFKL